MIHHHLKRSSTSDEDLWLICAAMGIYRVETSMIPNFRAGRQGGNGTTHLDHRTALVRPYQRAIRLHMVRARSTFGGVADEEKRCVVDDAPDTDSVTRTDGYTGVGGEVNAPRVYFE